MPTLNIYTWFITIHQEDLLQRERLQRQMDTQAPQYSLNCTQPSKEALRFSWQSFCVPKRWASKAYGMPAGLSLCPRSRNTDPNLFVSFGVLSSNVAYHMSGIKGQHNSPDYWTEHLGWVSKWLKQRPSVAAKVTERNSLRSPRAQCVGSAVMWMVSQICRTHCPLFSVSSSLFNRLKETPYGKRTVMSSSLLFNISSQHRSSTLITGRAMIDWSPVSFHQVL